MRSLGVFRGMAIVAVVVAHSAGLTMFALTFWGQHFGSPRPAPDLSWMGTPLELGFVALLQLPLFAVPVFLFASGVFVSFAARTSTGRLGWSTVRGWAGNLVLPYLIWGTLAVAFDVATGLLGKSAPTTDVASIIQERASDYYFVPLLAVLFCASPVLVPIAARAPLPMLGAMALAMVIFFGRRTAGLFGLDLPDWLFAFDGRQWGLATFFGLGLVIGRSSESVQRRLIGARWAITGAALVLGPLSVLEAHVLMHGDPYTFRPWQGVAWLGYSTMVALAVLAWKWRGGPLGGTFDWLGRQSLAIYLLQPITIAIGLKLAYHLLPPLLGQPGLFQQFLLAAAIGALLVTAGLGGACLVVIGVSRSWARRFERGLFGIASPPPRPGGRPTWRRRTAHRDRIDLSRDRVGVGL